MFSEGISTLDRRLQVERTRLLVWKGELRTLRLAWQHDANSRSSDWHLGAQNCVLWKSPNWLEYLSLWKLTRLHATFVMSGLWPKDEQVGKHASESTHCANCNPVHSDEWSYGWTQPAFLFTVWPADLQGCDRAALRATQVNLRYELRRRYF